MANESATKSYTVMDGEKATPIMAYTDNLIVYGDVVTKEIIRVSTWLRTPSVPQYIPIRDAHVVHFGGGAPKQVSFQTFLLPSSQVLAFHIKPPAQDPLDYDPKEPNRKMEPTTVMVGWFRFDGFLRMASISDLERYLEVAKENFTAIYDIEISQPYMPGTGIIRTPYALVRSERVMFATRSA